MKSLCALLFSAALLSAASVPLRVSRFEPGVAGRPDGWTIWAPRDEIAPRGYVDQVHSRGEGGSLALSGDSNPAEFGGWEYAISGVRQGKWYRFTAYYRAEGLTYEPRQIMPRLDWSDANGKRVGLPAIASSVTGDNGWRKVTLDTPAPDRAAGVKIQLFLANAPHATVWWDDISLEEIAGPASRKVTVASIFWRPSTRSTPETNLRTFVDVMDKWVPEKADLILLPEGTTVIGTGRSYVDLSEPVPGPTTKFLGEVAKRRNAYIAAGIYEREGKTVYNTAVLIGRKGELIGKYRKVYVPLGEIEGGLTPGTDYPVFQTDFGKVGMMICYDLQFPDPARGLTLRGADLILLPIWGGSEALGKARAIENHVHILASGYDFPTVVIDPDGEVLSRAPERGSAAVATIDIGRRVIHPYEGQLRTKLPRDVRLDVPIKIAGYE